MKAKITYNMSDPAIRCQYSITINEEGYVIYSFFAEGEPKTTQCKLTPKCFKEIEALLDKHDFFKFKDGYYPTDKRACLEALTIQIGDRVKHICIGRPRPKDVPAPVIKLFSAINRCKGVCV